MNQKYDVMVIGPVSLDHNIDYEGNERNEIGGAVVASGFAAAGSGAKTAIFCKFNSKDLTVSGCFGGIRADLYQGESAHTCAIKISILQQIKKEERVHLLAYVIRFDLKNCRR